MTIQAQTEKMMIPPKKPTPFEKPLKNWRDSKVIQDIIKQNPIIEKIQKGATERAVSDFIISLSKSVHFN